MKTIYILLAVLLLTSCSKGYYSHIPRTKTTVNHAITTPVKELKDTVYYQLIPAIVRDTIEKIAPKAMVLNELPLVIKDSITHLADTNKKYIKGDPEKGLRARTWSKVLTPIMYAISTSFAVGIVSYLSPVELGVLALGFFYGILMIVSTLTITFYYEEDNILFNRPAGKSRKVTVLRIFLLLGILLTLYLGVTGIIIFIISIDGTLFWILQAINLFMLIWNCIVWISMLWDEFSY